MEEAGKVSFRERVHKFVSLVYKPVFKTFYVNSLDQKTSCHPIGVFVSLGITTSLDVLENVKNFIASNKEFSASLVEIGSTCKDGTFLNTITSMEPKQFQVDNLEDLNLLGRDEAIQILGEMEKQMDPENASLETLKTLAPKATRLKYLIEKLDESDGWEAHKIQQEPDGYRIYHLFINYKKEGDTEYRIGIFVKNEK